MKENIKTSLKIDSMSNDMKNISFRIYYYNKEKENSKAI